MEVPTEDFSLLSFWNQLWDENRLQLLSQIEPLAEKLSGKNEKPYHIPFTWIRTLLYDFKVGTHVCEGLLGNFPQNPTRGFH